jgi:hypothetical protein
LWKLRKWREEEEEEAVALLLAHSTPELAWDHLCVSNSSQQPFYLFNGSSRLVVVDSHDLIALDFRRAFLVFDGVRGDRTTRRRLSGGLSSLRTLVAQL